MENSNLTRFAAPALGVLAALVAFVGPWMGIDVSFGGESQSQSFTLKELIDEDVLVMRWFWISLVGVVLLIASAALTGDMGKNLAQAGALLTLVLPVRTIIDIFTDGDDIVGADVSAGWGLWVVTALAALALLASRFMPADEHNDVQPLQRVEGVERTER